MDNFGDSTLRWPDGVDVIEAESNPAHGQYIGNWAPVRATQTPSHSQNKLYTFT